MYKPSLTLFSAMVGQAVFSQEIHNEVSGTLRMEKVQLPDSAGSPYKMTWTEAVDLSKIKTVAEKYKSLPFESATSCCDYSDIRWDAFRLKFNVSVAGKIVGHAMRDPMRLKAIEHVVCLTIEVHPGNEEKGISEKLLSHLVE
jgi:hypothetical protein